MNCLRKLKFWKRRSVKPHRKESELLHLMERLESTYRESEIAMVEKLQLQNELEANLRARISILEKRVKDQEHLEGILNAQIRRLEDECNYRRRQCEELSDSLTEERLEKEVAIMRITEIKNKLQEKDMEMRNMEENQKCVINELSERFTKSNSNSIKEVAGFQGRIKDLNEKLKATNNEKKEYEHTPPGKMKRVVALMKAVVGVVVLAALALGFNSLVYFSLVYFSLV